MNFETMNGNRRAGRMVALQEYILQGSILDSSCEMLLHRLRGLCDNSDSPTETFEDKEYVYSIRQSTNGQFLNLRVRQDRYRKDFPWHLRYLGQSEIGDKNRATMVRSCIDVACSEKICDFLTEMGFKFTFSYLTKGYLFKKGRMKVIVAKVAKEGISPPSNPLQPITSDNGTQETFITNSYLVEVSVVAPSGQDALADEIRAFCDQLKPLVQMEKIDSRRLV